MFANSNFPGLALTAPVNAPCSKPKSSDSSNSPGNAAQFYALVQKYGNKQTQIQVFGSAPSGAVASRTNRDRDEESARSSRGERRVNSRGNSRRVASLESDGRPQSFVQNGIRYVRVR